MARCSAPSPTPESAFFSSSPRSGR
jgi:hypothetical protein